MDLEPDYSRYTLDELLDVKNNIDKDSYPDRYQRLLSEIDQRRLNNKPQPVRLKVSEKLSKDKKPVIKKLSYRGEQVLGLILFSIILAISIFFKETPGSRRGRAFTQEGDPEMYWFLVSLWILGVIYFLYKLIKDIVTNPKEQQKTPPLS